MFNFVLNTKYIILSCLVLYSYISFDMIAATDI